MRLAIAALLVAASTLPAFAESDRIAQPDGDRFSELAAVSGPLYPAGGFIEQRICEIKRDFYVGCMHMLLGKQEGGSKQGNYVFDLYTTWGVVARRGRFDITPLAGVSTLTTIMYIGQWLIWPVTQEVPSAKETFSVFPFEATASVALGYSFVKKGRFRARAELAVRAHVPLFTDSTVELPNPHGIGTTFGIGAGF